MQDTGPGPMEQQQEEAEPAATHDGPPASTADEPARAPTPPPDYGPEEWEAMELPSAYLPLPLLRVGF